MQIDRDMIQFLAIVLLSLSTSAAIMVDYGLNEGNYGNAYPYTSIVGPLAANLGLYYYGDGQEDYQDYYPYRRYALNYGAHDPYDSAARNLHEIGDGSGIAGTYDPNGPVRTGSVVDYVADNHDGLDAIIKEQGDSIHAIPTILGRRVSVTPEYYGYEKHY